MSYAYFLSGRVHHIVSPKPGLSFLVGQITFVWHLRSSLVAASLILNSGLRSQTSRGSFRTGSRTKISFEKTYEVFTLFPEANRVLAISLRPIGFSPAFKATLDHSGPKNHHPRSLSLNYKFRHQIKRHRDKYYTRRSKYLRVGFTPNRFIRKCLEFNPIRDAQVRNFATQKDSPYESESDFSTAPQSTIFQMYEHPWS